MYSRKPLPILALIEAIAIDEGDKDIDKSAMTTEEDIMHWCSSFLRKSISGNLEFAHSTVQEYLMGIEPTGQPQLAAYVFSDRGIIETYFARTCLIYLEMESFYKLRFKLVEMSDDDWMLAFPFLNYASSYWNDHAIFTGDESGAIDLCKKLFSAAYALSVKSSSSVNYGWRWIRMRIGWATQKRLKSRLCRRQSYVTRLLLTLHIRLVFSGLPCCTCHDYVHS